jgi:hypothetical protein
MKKTALAIAVVLGLAALGVAAQIYLVPTDVHAQSKPVKNPDPP